VFELFKEEDVPAPLSADDNGSGLNGESEGLSRQIF